MRDKVKSYLCSLPERVVRSTAAMAGGLLHEASELVLPARVRRSRLYRSLVEMTLRFLIEQVGQVEGTNAGGEELPKDFLARRAAGNVIEGAGILSFHASPVWVLAALADLSGAGRDIIREIADALEHEGLLQPGQGFGTMNELLDGLERTAGRLAETVNTPPLDVVTLRQEWTALRAELPRIPRTRMPSAADVRAAWQSMKQEAAAQGRSVFEVSTALAVSAVRNLPENARWLSMAAKVSVKRTGQVLAQGLLDHYRATLAEMHECGYARYWWREFRPYVTAAVKQFSPARTSLTERLMSRRRAARTRG